MRRRPIGPGGSTAESDPARSPHRDDRLADLLAARPGRRRRPPPDDADAPPADAFQPDPAWKPLGHATSGSTPRRTPPDPPRPGRPPRGAARAPALPEGDQGARGDPRDRRRPPADPRRPAPDRRRAGPPGPVPPQVRAPRRHRRSPSSSSGTRTARPDRADAREWVKDETTGKPARRLDWVFAGSELVRRPRRPRSRSTPPTTAT